MTEHSKQVELERGEASKNSRVTYIAWIPEKFAVVGKVLDFKDDNGVWSVGWTVTAVYTRQSTLEVRERSRDHLRQRKSSDI